MFAKIGFLDNYRQCIDEMVYVKNYLMRRYAYENSKPIDQQNSGIINSLARGLREQDFLIASLSVGSPILLKIKDELDRGLQPANELDKHRSYIFWINDPEEHKQIAENTQGYCCFNHIIGEPIKYGEPNPLYPFQTDIIIPAFEKYDAIWILKATGLGVTEISLRYMMWKAITGDRNKYFRSIMPIIVGPNVDLAKKLIARAKYMWFSKLRIEFDDRDKQLTLPINNVTIEAFPSENIRAFRSLENVSMLLVDEGDYFRKGEQKQVLVAAERYFGKSGAKIILVSTPGAPGGLMETIDVNPNSIYHKLRLDYTYGIDKIYTPEDIEKAKRSPSFEQEYNLKYLGEIGNIFNIQNINYATNILGKTYDPNDEDRNTNPMITRAMGVDPGFGPSMFGIVVQQWIDGKIEIIHVEQIERSSSSQCLERVLRLAQKYHVMKIYVDSSAPGFIADLKIRYKEPLNYAKMIKDNPQLVDIWIRSDPSEGGIKVVPINFRMKHEEMLIQVERFLQKQLLKIHPSFDKLAIALSTATSKGDKYDLDKDSTTYDDLLDALQLSLLNIRLRAK